MADKAIARGGLGVLGYPLYICSPTIRHFQKVMGTWQKCNKKKKTINDTFWSR